jgi:hypothetical protein
MLTGDVRNHNYVPNVFQQEQKREVTQEDIFKKINLQTAKKSIIGKKLYFILASCIGYFKSYHNGKQQIKGCLIISSDHNNTLVRHILLSI